MTDVQHPVDAGHYARQQIHSRDPLIAWSHRRRFRAALALARPFAGGRLLDYGCGDGTFLGLLQTSGAAPALAVGAEIDPRVVVDCRAPVRGGSGSAVRGRRRSRAGRPRGSVRRRLLHGSPGARDGSAAAARRLRAPARARRHAGDQCADRNRIAGSRQAGRPPRGRLATDRRLPRHLELHTAGAGEERVRRVETTHRTPGVSSDPTAASFHDHKGFNWRVLRATVASRFDLVRTVTSPFNWPGPHLGTQVWFVARTRAAGVSR